MGYLKIIDWSSVNDVNTQSIMLFLLQSIISPSTERQKNHWLIRKNLPTPFSGYGPNYSRKKFIAWKESIPGRCYARCACYPLSYWCSMTKMRRNWVKTANKHIRQAQITRFFGVSYAPKRLSGSTRGKTLFLCFDPNKPFKPLEITSKYHIAPLRLNFTWKIVAPKQHCNFFQAVRCF